MGWWDKCGTFFDGLLHLDICMDLDNLLLQFLEWPTQGPDIKLIDPK